MSFWCGFGSPALFTPLDGTNMHTLDLQHVYFSFKSLAQLDVN